MNKIIKKALETCTPSVDALLTVINATDNPEIATEIMLGIYEYPVVNPTSSKLEANYHKPQATSYNPISNKVNFTYEVTDSEDGWFDKDEKITSVETAVVQNTWSTDTAYQKFVENNPTLHISLQEFKDKYTRRRYIKGLTGRISNSWVSLTDWQ